ncbi:MAG: AHH domain-containing protein [Planctomycetaceae bacterium]
MNGPENGVGLPVCQYKKDLKEQPKVHFKRHLGGYEKYVRKQLDNVNTKEEALAVINHGQRALWVIWVAGAGLRSGGQVDT